MFNISFAELIFFATVALLILGPEKLPQTIRSALAQYRKIKAQINKFQTDFEHELELIELKSMMQEELLKIKAMEDQLKTQLDAMQSEIASLHDQSLSTANITLVPDQPIPHHQAVSVDKKISTIYTLQPYQSRLHNVPYLRSRQNSLIERISA